MRLGIDAFNLASDRRGMGRYVRSVLRGLDRIAEIALVLIVPDPENARAVREEFAYPAMTHKQMRQSPCDAVWFPWNAMRFPPHAPSAATIHDLFAFTYPHSNPVARWREQRPILRSIRCADVLLAVSKWTAHDLRERFDVEPARVAIAPPAIEPFWHPADAPESATYVMFVAGPEPRKNAAFLFGVFDEAFRSNGVELVVAGALAEADENAFAQMRAARRRVRPDDEALRALYSGALAVAVPSAAEGYGLPAIEAMACGAPVIASDAGALPETCDGAALLVPAGDRDAWREELRRVAGDSTLRRELRARGLQRVARIDPEAPAKALTESLRRLLSAAP